MIGIRPPQQPQLVGEADTCHDKKWQGEEDDDQAIEQRQQSGAEGVATGDPVQARKALQQWIVTDGKGRKTTVSLENLQAGIEPDPKLFVVKIKRDSKNGP